jgi:voltage-gated potassium channel
VHFKCPDCGLTRHDADAVHCKHCGKVIHIETEGLD